MTEISCIGILAHPLRAQTYPVAESIAHSLAAHHIQTTVFKSWEEHEVQTAIRGCDMVIAIGGDGAMLRAARVCAPFSVPVLGINMGQLGFLTEIHDPKNWETSIAPLLAGNYWIEERMMIRVSLLRGESVIVTDDALNDVVISGNVTGRMAQLETYIDSDWATTYFADALIIATATGSTAYALACGGPILPPELKNILIVPSAPHLSMDRPIVLSEGATVEVKASSTSRGEVVLTNDGIMLATIEPEDTVRIHASEYESRFVRLRGKNYFYRSLLDRLEPRIRRPKERESDE